jgi:hypothetical protein
MMKSECELRDEGKWIESMMKEAHKKNNDDNKKYKELVAQAVKNESLKVLRETQTVNQDLNHP